MPKVKGLCHICNSNKILRFLTERLQICDKCLSTVRGKNINIDQIKGMIRIVINETYKEYSISRANNEAEKLLLSKMGKIEKFVSLFYKTESYLERHSIIANKIFENENNKIHSIRTEKYKAFLQHPNFDDYLLTNEEVNIIKLYKAYQKFIITENSQIVERLPEEEWLILRKRIILNDGYICNKCGKNDKKAEFHLHHIIPLQEYGTNHENNLVLLCRNCHQKQHLGFKISKKKLKTSLQSKKKNVQKFCAVHEDDFQDIKGKNIVQFYCPSCQNKLFVDYKNTWTPTYCIYCDFEFEIRKSINEGIQIRTPHIENMIILCPQCKQKLRIKCGVWLYARCPACYIEFEVFGSYNKFDYKIRPSTRIDH